MIEFATLEDVITLSGKTYSSDDLVRVERLLPLVSDALRFEAEKVGKDLDEMIENSDSYANVVKLVTVDIVIRAMRQSYDGEPLTQYSQSALGSSVSGTYSIPGGGVAGAIMRNDLKRLGLKRQKYGVIELWTASSTE